MAFSTPHNLFNWCRAYNSGLDVCLRMDALPLTNVYVFHGIRIPLWSLQSLGLFSG